jgi:hypothetical protein
LNLAAQAIFDKFFAFQAPPSPISAPAANLLPIA